MKGKNFISGIVMVATLCCWPSIASPQSFSLILEKLNRLEERLNNLEANQQGDIKRLQNQLSEIQTGQEVTSLVKAINWLRGQVDGVVAARLDQKARTNPNRATEIVNGLPMDTSEATDLLYELMVKYPIPEQEPPIESKTIPELKESEITGLGDILNATINDRLNGITFEAVYTSEISSNMFGGLRRATEYLDNVDLTLPLTLNGCLAGKELHFFYMVWATAAAIQVKMSVMLKSSVILKGPTHGNSMRFGYNRTCSWVSCPFWRGFII